MIKLLWQKFSKTCHFYGYRNIAINNTKDLSGDKLCRDDKKNLLNFIFLKKKVVVNNIHV